jgi:CHAD domain-containing protein
MISKRQPKDRRKSASQRKNQSAEGNASDIAITLDDSLRSAVPNDKQIEDKQIDEKHVDEKHVDEKHIDEKHIDEKHVDEKHIAVAAHLAVQPSAIGSSVGSEPLETGPTFVVETSLVSVVVPKFNDWLGDLANAVPRVVNQNDVEAVHDMRVALRRIRSLLRVVREVFGRFHVTRIREEMRQAAAATGALRDEEVLAETLGAIELPAPHPEILASWLSIRAYRERELRNNVIQLLLAGALDAPQSELRALITLPVRPSRDKEATRFARRVVLSVHKEVEALRTVDVTSVQGMHNLRIAYKRLRYAVEALGPVLPAELRAWGQVAAAFQKVLGCMHDYDVALETIRGAVELPEVTRAALVEVLSQKRCEQAQKYCSAEGFELCRKA